MTQKPTPSSDRQPVLVIAAGRQRVGKTVFLNTVAQFLKERDSDVVLWNGDQTNVTNNLRIFHSDVHEPVSREPGDGKTWLEERIGHIAEHGYDAILDVGGGDTAFTRLVKELDVSEMLREAGVRVVLANLMGPDPADADYLAGFLETERFRPADILIILNRGLVDSGVSVLHAFKPVTDHPVIKDALDHGAELLVFPVLGCMGAVTERGLSFQEALSGKRREGGTSLSFVDRERVKLWWRVAVPEFMKKIPPLMLPAMRSDDSTTRPQAAE